MGITSSASPLLRAFLSYNNMNRLLLLTLIGFVALTRTSAKPVGIGIGLPQGGGLTRRSEVEEERDERWHSGPVGAPLTYLVEEERDERWYSGPVGAPLT